MDKTHPKNTFAKTVIFSRMFIQLCQVAIEGLVIKDRITRAHGCATLKAPPDTVE
jgi:hypothetical protein